MRANQLNQKRRKPLRLVAMPQASRPTRKAAERSLTAYYESFKRPVAWTQKLLELTMPQTRGPVSFLPASERTPHRYAWTRGYLLATNKNSAWQKKGPRFSPEAKGSRDERWRLMLPSAILAQELGPPVPADEDLELGVYGSLVRALAEETRARVQLAVR